MKHSSAKNIIIDEYLYKHADYTRYVTVITVNKVNLFL
jgi:hypothetical protein